MKVRWWKSKDSDSYCVSVEGSDHALTFLFHPRHDVETEDLPHVNKRMKSLGTTTVIARECSLWEIEIGHIPVAEKNVPKVWIDTYKENIAYAEREERAST